MALRFPRILAFSFAALAACQPVAPAGSDPSIVDVPHTAVERQSIGNCWLYAQAAWTESLHKAGTSLSFDVSESYWTYFHWYEQIVPGWSSEIQTGGFWSTGVGLTVRYGIVPEGLFVPADSEQEISLRQKAALEAINAALKTGTLKTTEARKDRVLVRQVMDQAWGLAPEVSAWLDAAFGKGVEKTLVTAVPADLTGSPIIKPADFKVAYARWNAVSNTSALEPRTLAEAVSEWSEDYYPYEESERREFLQRVQRALHARQPLVLVWDVDFNAWDKLSTNAAHRGAFSLEVLEAKGPGRQGGHMSVLEDYAAETTAFGKLEAGITLDPTKPEDAAKLEAALADDTEITLLRIKNSWGTQSGEGAHPVGFPGYNDLHMDYLNGPIKWCYGTNDDGTPACDWTTTPFSGIVLPPAF